MDDPTSHHHGREVAIVGAGMTGLCACKHLLQHGFRPTVLEARQSLGGIWRHTCSITKLQTARDAYQFSDFLWPPGTPPNPMHDQVVDYLEDYATHFHVRDRILFYCEVVEIKSRLAGSTPFTGLWADQAFLDGVQTGDGGKAWDVRVRKTTPGQPDVFEEEWLAFDFLVICVGRFGDCPKFPTYASGKGPELFSGTVLHSTEYGRLDNEAAKKLISGKRVVVAGYMKSAIDITMEASNANHGVHGQPCHLIFRSTNWMFINKKLFGKLASLLYFTRFSEMLNYKPGQSWLQNLLTAFLSPLRWARTKLVEWYLLYHLPLQRYGLIPKHSFSAYASSCKLFVLPDLFFPKVERNEIILHKVTEWGFSKKGIVLDDGTEIAADVVILATGYDSNKKLISLLPKEYSSLLVGPSGIIPLYRGAIHPRIPHLAILGYQYKFSHLQSSELASRWLAYFLSGRFSLPSVSDMEKDAHGWVEHLQKATPFPQQLCLGAAGIWHSDQMCRDMGWSPFRKNGWISELFSPYSNMDYNDLGIFPSVTHTGQSISAKMKMEDGRWKVIT